MKAKQIYTREDLTTRGEDPGGFVVLTCGLCGGTSLETELIEHDDCPLVDPGVTHVRMTAVRTRVVIRGPRRLDGKLWWIGPSGTVYDIERRGQGRNAYYVMIEHGSGKAVKDNGRLSDIRKYIVDNQGRL